METAELRPSGGYNKEAVPAARHSNTSLFKLNLPVMVAYYKIEFKMSRGKIIFFIFFFVSISWGDNVVMRDQQGGG